MKPNLIETLIATVGEIGPAPDGSPVYRLIEDTPFGPVKLRAYASEAEARDIERLLSQLGNKIDHPEYLGRWQRYILFRYVPAKTVDAAADDQELYFQIGRFLATLNTIADHQNSPTSLEVEFKVWLEKIDHARILPSRLVERAYRAYAHAEFRNLPICLDYWDAMPHNFGWVQGRLSLLDEKHLRRSHPGVGLVKPSLNLHPAQWEHIRRGYASVTPIDVFDRHRSQIEQYYLVNALYRYAINAEVNTIYPANNIRFLNYRDLLIDKLSQGRGVEKIEGELSLYLTYPESIPGLVRRRLSMLKSALRKR